VEAAREPDGRVSSPHLLLALGQESRGAVGDLLKSFDVTAQQIREAVQQSAATGVGPSGNPLDRYGRDLTRLAADGRFDPIVGRDTELRRIVQVLSRRFKNNPILIGGPG